MFSENLKHDPVADNGQRTDGKRVLLGRKFRKISIKQQLAQSWRNAFQISIENDFVLERVAGIEPAP